MLHSPCPMVVTLHDLPCSKRRSEHLRTGLRLRLRHARGAARGARDRADRRRSRPDAVERLRLEPSASS